LSAIKVWAENQDPILACLCQNLIQRNLYHVEVSAEPFPEEKVQALIEKARQKFHVSKEDAAYFVFTETIRNDAYKVGDGNIRIQMKDGSIQDITTASDNSNLEALAKTVKKYILCSIKGL